MSNTLTLHDTVKITAVARNITKVERWFDREARVWVVQKFDMDGNQIGDAGLAGTKAGAVAYEKEFLTELSVQKELTR